MTKTLANRSLMLILVFLSQLFLASWAAAAVVDRIVAEVNDEIITMSELEAMSKTIDTGSGINPKGKEGQAIQRQMLDALIDRKLARAEAKRRGINISDRDIDQALEEFKKRTNLVGDAALNQALAQSGLTLKELRQQIADQIQQERLQAVAVGAKVTVSDAEVRRFFEDFAKEGGNQAHLRIIRLPFPPGATAAQKEESKQKAEMILKEVQLGGAFAEVARKYSVSETDMGFISLNDMPPQLVEYLNRLKPKEVAPIQTPEGFQLVQLVARRSGTPPSFEEAAPEIRKLLIRREMDKRFSEWVKTLREKAYIKIML